MMSQSSSQLEASLQFVSGPLAQQIVRLGDQQTWIGSDPRSHICISAPSIQPFHAYLGWDRGHLIIESYQQGLVTVNQQSISGAPYILANGDMVGLGQAGIAFRVTLNSASTNSLPQQPNTIHAYPHQSSAFISLAHTETTRYLCAAAHIDVTFRNYLLKSIVNEQHRAVGEAYGVDIIPVIKCCFAARQRTFIRDSILFSILLLYIVFTLFATGPFGFDSLLLRLPIYFLPFIYFIPFIVWILLIIDLLIFFALVSLIVRLVKLPLFMRNLVYLILLLFFFLPLLPYCLLAWIVVVVEKAITYYGPMMRQLTKGKFRPDAIPDSPNPNLEHKLRQTFNTQGGKVIAYSGSSPFTGAGYLVDGWSIAIDTTKEKQDSGETFTPLAFQVTDMYDHIVSAIEALGLSKRADIRLEDILYVNGQEIRDDKRFLSDPFVRPRTEMDLREMKDFMKNPTEDIRYYKCVRVTSWRGELVLSIFFRFVMAGKNLFIEANFLLLPPLKEEYYQIDTLEPTPTIGKIWQLAKHSFLPSALFLLRSPISMFSWLFGAWLVQREDMRTQRSIHDNPAFDYGASTSLREVASSSDYRRFFQRLDKEMYTKIIEQQMLESIVDFLDSKNIDTSSLRERQAVIQNNSTIITGSTISGTGIAIGAKAQATFTNASKSQTAGA